jgi:radical SAM-linked protein
MIENPLKLLLFQKPSRYINNEINAIAKDIKEGVKWALVFPDLYEVGMSSLGIQILYHVLNSVPWISAERVFVPFPDAEEFLKKNRLEITSLETKKRLSEFDIVGFSLTTELNFTNILTILKLSSIPLHSEDRKNLPIVIGGGPACFNPAPVEPFFDAFFLGEGEEGVIEISEVIKEGKKNASKREEILKALSKIKGVYVPGFSTEKIEKRIVPDLNSAPFPTKPILPFTTTVHDRATIEIARGCTKGCRFCLAGFISRPTRERSPQEVVKIVEEVLKNTGYEEVSLLSLSTCDYTRINELISGLMEIISEKKISLSLPSLRVGTLSAEVLRSISKVMRTGITLAPEAGTERLRKVINKEFSNSELLRDVETILANGWDHLKFYFMIGLPTETDKDREEIINLVKEVVKMGKKITRRFNISLNISTFVPKPHTPFQWERQLDLKSAEEILQHFKKRLKMREVDIRYHSPALSYIEGVLARGDKQLSKVIEKAHELGARLDGWSEFFRRETWEKAFEICGINPEDYLRERDLSEKLPWEHLSTLVEKEILINERKKAFAEETTEDCFKGTCYKCGVCDFKNIMPRPKAEPVYIKSSGVYRRGKGTWIIKIRSKLTKKGIARFLSHKEFISVIQRAVRRADIPVVFSKGFHPLPRISFGFPPPVGIESEEEYVDFEIYGPFHSGFVNLLNSQLPEGIKVISAREVPLNLPSIYSSTKGFVYHYMFLDGIFGEKELREKLNLFLSSPPSINGKNLKDFFSELSLEENSIKVFLNVISEKTINPYQFISLLLGLPQEEIIDKINVKRVSTLLEY